MIWCRFGWHRWKRWTDYTWDGIVGQVTPWVTTTEDCLPVTESRQHRRCLDCGMQQDRLVRRKLRDR